MSPKSTCTDHKEIKKDQTEIQRNCKDIQTNYKKEQNKPTRSHSKVIKIWPSGSDLRRQTLKNKAILKCRLDTRLVAVIIHWHSAASGGNASEQERKLRQRKSEWDGREGRWMGPGGGGTDGNEGKDKERETAKQADARLK